MCLVLIHGVADLTSRAVVKVRWSNIWVFVRVCICEFGVATWAYAMFWKISAPWEATNTHMRGTADKVSRFLYVVIRINMSDNVGRAKTSQGS